MDLLNKNELKSLTQERKHPCISIYIPTNREWDKMGQDIITFKNQIRKLEKDLKEKKLRDKEIDSLLKPARLLLEDTEFWNHQSEGLAVFIAPGEFLTYRLPLKFDELLVISHRFHLKPMLPLLSGDGRYFVLTLNQKRIQLYQGSKYSLSELDLPEDAILSMDEFMKWDESEKSLQFHSQTSRATSAGPLYAAGSRSAIFHGHGSGGLDDTTVKEKILEFFQMADKGVHQVVQGENAPMVLAGVEPLNPIYKEANSYPALLDNTINKNPQDLSVKELHQLSWEIVKPVFDKAENNAREKFQQFNGNDLVSSNLEEIIKSVYQNRVDSLFVELNSHLWGRYLEDKNEIIIDNAPGEENEDLLDLAAVKTFMTGGKVFVIKRDEMPNGSPACALFRF